MAKKDMTSSKEEIKNEIQNLVKKQLGNYLESEETSLEAIKSKLTEGFAEDISEALVNKIENPELDNKLEILYNHEKHFLDILKDYKEEIKFAESLQADIRKEQAAFFSSTLKEVCTSLKETQIDQQYQVQWIFDLVKSYTSSLKISSRLAEDHVISLLGEIQEKADKEISKNTKKTKDDNGNI